MKNKKSLILIIIILLAGIGGIYVYILGLASGHNLGYSNDRPYYISTEPMTLKKTRLPVGTKIFYNKSVWRKGELKKPMKEKEIYSFSFPTDDPLIFSGLPVSEMSRFANPEVLGFNILVDFEKINKENPSHQLICTPVGSIHIQDKENWSFDPTNINSVELCGVRFYRNPQPQQAQIPENLLKELQKIKDEEILN